jgi:GT2 family glycosyltransferase
MQLTVVVPAYNASSTLERCLLALFRAEFGRSEVVVVDDGSTDGTAEVARRLGVGLVRHDTPQRPAEARNAGARAADAPLIAFVDADVAVHGDVRDRILDRFAAEPDLEALFGSYDTAPPAPAVVSRYRNLLHHFVHRRAAAEAETFWTGLGAVRRTRFEALGGFDPAWDYLEDVEFGLRLRAQGGRIRLDPDIQGTHLKAWTLRSMMRTDLWGRAVPWTRLLRSRSARTGSLNTAREHQAAAGAVALMAASVLAAPAWPPAAFGALGGAALFWAANARFFAFLARVGGPVFALRAAPYHAAHYAAALAGYLWVRIVERPG